ncbi:Metacaspase-5 [Cladobotryum mycophilum]|uniref:Metacaspase-5 n=1 Tax=Cladobotryum mycophilum TaxID=491253 RepID=A0ABR0S7R3_9HYPO
MPRVTDSSNSTALIAPRVLLIGINYYQPASDSFIIDLQGRPAEIPNLRGSVADVTAIETHFRDVYGVDPSSIVKLTSTLPSCWPDGSATSGSTEPAEAKDKRATSDNIRRALKDILECSEPETPVYIHYSGHGTRAPTACPSIKGEGEWDECLVPCDVLCGGSAITDLELGVTLYLMSKKGLRVTVVLDCCHSGGATRDDDQEDIKSRGLDQNWMHRHLPPQFAEYEAIAKKALSELEMEDGISSLAISTNWLNEPAKYELITACEAHEKAAETDGHGVLSYHLLEVLKSAGTNLPTHGMLYQRLRGSILAWKRSHKVDQNPGFAGDTRRCFLSNHVAEHVSSIQITTETIGRKPYLYIEAGTMHGVEDGSTYRVYEWSTTDFNHTNSIATVVVSKAKPTRSLVELCPGHDVGLKDLLTTPGVGYLAVEYRLAKNNLVQLKWSATTPQTTELLEVAEEMNCVFVDHASPRYWIHVKEVHGKDKYLLNDGNDMRIPNIPTFSTPKSLFLAIKKLERYYKIMHLENTESSLSYSFGIKGKDIAARSVTMSHGEEFALHIKNKTEKPLRLVVINLQPLYGIERLYPAPGAFCGAIGQSSQQPNPPFSLITMNDVADAEEPVIDRFRCLLSTESIDYDFMQQDDIMDDLDWYDDEMGSISRGTNELESLVRGARVLHFGQRACSKCALFEVSAREALLEQSSPQSYLEQCAYLTVYLTWKRIAAEFTFESRPDVKLWVKASVAEVVTAYSVEKKPYLEETVRVMRLLGMSSQCIPAKVALGTMLIHVHYELYAITGTFTDALEVINEQYIHYQFISDEDVVAGALEMAHATSLDKWMDAKQIPFCQNSLSQLLLHRYERRGDVKDLNRGIQLAELSCSGILNDPVPLVSLGGLLKRRYDAFGKEDDLNTAIDTFMTARSCQGGEDIKSIAMMNLSTCLQDRYERRGRLDDLIQGIDLATGAVNATTHKSSRAQRLNGLSALWARRYECTEDPEHLRIAIEYSQQCLETDPSHPLMHQHLSNSASWLSWRFERDREKYSADLDVAIDRAKGAVNRTSPSNIFRLVYLGNLCKMIGFQYERDGSPHLLDAAILVGDQGRLASTPGSISYMRILNNLSEVLVMKYKLLGNPDDIQRAVEQWESVVNDRSFPPVYAVNMAVDAVRILLRYERYKDALRIAKATIPLLAKASPRSLQAGDQQRILSRYAGLASDAAALTLQCEDEAAAAACLLEQGRCILADHQYQSRSSRSLVALNEEHPHIASRLNMLMHSIDTPAGAHDRPGRIDAADDLDRLIGETRELPGFERFLSSPSRDELCDMARKSNKTVVIVNVSFRCDAFIIHPGAIEKVCLPAVAKDTITKMADDWATSDTTGCHRILGSLWDDIASPILAHLGLTAKNQATEGALARICWIPTGILCRLPLHAAGHHVGQMTDTVLNFAISSYSASVKAMAYTLQNRKKSASETNDTTMLRSLQSALLVSMTETPNLKRLPTAAPEVHNIEARLSDKSPSTKIAQLPMPTRQQVLDQLAVSQIFHFAGHGMLDYEDISRSGLVMSDGCLTVADMQSLELHHNPPLLAYLSACSTGTNSSRRLFDENMHLVSACQIAGFQNVIGTFWEVSDEFSASIALAVYTELCEKPTLRLSEALHNAVKRGRDRGLERMREEVSRNGVIKEKRIRYRTENPRWWAGYFFVGLD